MHDMISPPHATTPPLSLRERKKRLAQATIEEAALQLFQRQGYEHTSIQDIADAVMMSPRTFFRYFTSKEELLSAPMQGILKEGLHTLQRVSPAELPHSALTVMLMDMARLYQQQKGGFLARYQVAMQTPSLASVYLYTWQTMEFTISDALCSHPETGTSRHEICFLVALCITAFRVAITEWLEQEASGDLPALLRENLERLSFLGTQKAV